MELRRQGQGTGPLAGDADPPGAVRAEVGHEGSGGVGGGGGHVDAPPGPGPQVLIGFPRPDDHQRVHGLRSTPLHLVLVLPLPHR